MFVINRTMSDNASHKLGPIIFQIVVVNDAAHGGSLHYYENHPSNMNSHLQHNLDDFLEWNLIDQINQNIKFVLMFHRSR